MSSKAIETLKESYAYCQRLTKKEARNFYFAFITLPKHKRHAIFAVYSFARIADDIADGSKSFGQKKELLEKLREDLHSAALRKANHPIFIALSDVISNFNINPELFDQLIDGVEMDLERSRFLTFNDLSLYCYHVASVIGLISIEIFGYKDERAREAAKSLGIAMQITNIMRDLKEDFLADRVYIPTEDLEFYGYSEEDLKNSVINENFLNLMHYQAQRARQFYKSGSELFQYINPRSRACVVVLHGLYLRLLDKLENEKFQVFEKKVRLSSSRKLIVMVKLWITSFLIKSR